MRHKSERNDLLCQHLCELAAVFVSNKIYLVWGNDEKEKKTCVTTFGNVPTVSGSESTLGQMSHLIGLSSPIALPLDALMAMTKV
jgi:hypothetical protein